MIRVFRRAASRGWRFDRALSWSDRALITSTAVPLTGAGERSRSTRSNVRRLAAGMHAAANPRSPSTSLVFARPS